MKKNVLSNVVVSVTKKMQPVPATQGLLDVNARVKTVFPVLHIQIHDTSKFMMMKVYTLNLI